MKLVLIGIQGSGKSTQGNLLSKQLHIPYLSTGHIFREIAKEKTELGRYVKLTMNAGFLIPDEKTIEIVNNYISRPEYKNGYIIDGFPRTVKQAEEFTNHVDRVIYLEIPDKEALWRIAHRDDNRADETLPALKKRIDAFNKFTRPVLEYYDKQKRLVTIDGTQSIEEVNKEILRSVGKQVIKNQVEAWSKKRKSIIAIVGLPGAGKTEASEYFEQKGLPIVHFGNVLNDYIDKNGLEHDEATHKKLREGWRKEHGLGAFAIMNKENITKALEENTIIVIDGMRSWEEYMYLKKEFQDVDVYILCLFADKQTRYQRISGRKHRYNLFGEERDVNELLSTNMGPTIAFADFMIKNNFSKDDLYDKLDEVYRQVYYT